MGYFQVRYDSRVVIYDCLVAMGGDSRSEGRGFESRPYTGWTFFHIYLLQKIVMFD